MRRISFRSELLSLCGTRWTQEEVRASSVRGAKSGREIEKGAREPAVPRRVRSLQGPSMRPVDLHRKVSRRSRSLCFAALLRRMTVFTTCWKCRKKANARLGGGGGEALSSHVRTLVGPALVDEISRSFSLSLFLSGSSPRALATLRLISFFLRDRHTRRLIKSATKSSSLHRRAENGPLTDSPAELLRDLLPRRFLSPFSISLARFFLLRCVLFVFSPAAMFLPQSYDMANDASFRD